MLVVDAVPLRQSVRAVGRDLRYQLRAETLEVDRAGVVKSHRDTERAALPGRLKDELAVSPGKGVGAAVARDRLERRRVRHAAAPAGVSGSPVPTMLSRVTSAASSPSPSDSVSGGRIGSTR